jgi:predicted nucleotidyltransferase component of viral defense system
MLSEVYRAQVRLLVRTLPFVAAETCFALKGGTAINLFIRDLPRLSVDIDLAYLPVEERAVSLAAIEAALKRIRQSVLAGIPQSTAQVTRTGEGTVTGLLVAQNGVQVKVEVTPVIRGSVYPAVTMTVSEGVENDYGFAEMQVVSFADLYAGKLAAALDRQHPRDLFDVRDLLRNEGVSDELRAAFAVYMISHHRPMAEVLSAVPKDLTHDFEHAFAGMTDDGVTLAELQAARTEMVEKIVGGMPEKHRKLLLSVEAGKPDWTLLGIAGADTLPAVKWRLHNIGTLTDAKRAENVTALAAVLGVQLT